MDSVSENFSAYTFVLAALFSANSPAFELITYMMCRWEMATNASSVGLKELVEDEAYS